MRESLKTLKELPVESLSYSKNKQKAFTFSLILLIAFNMMLGLALHKVRSLATIHALILPAIAILTLFFKKPYPSLMLLSYIANCHVLWRMTKAKVFWEYSKYVSILIIILILLRYVKHIKNFILPGLFIFFLGISIPLTINYYGSFALIRRAISFNLSGPVLLALSVMLFYNIKIPKSRMRGVLFSLVMPTISIATISLYSIMTKQIIFTGGSNFAASGGFGPNQVSATLGLGALIALILGLNYFNKTSEKTLMFILSFWLFIQSLLTFSRGGIFNFTLSIIAFLWYSIRDKNTRFKALSSVILLSSLLFIMLPKIQRLTQGQLEERFTNLDPTGRDKIALAEIRVFEEHPLFGVGPGVGISERSGILGRYVASHTEYTRLPAEHGIFGLMALATLIWIILIPIKRSKTADIKAENAAFVLWTLAEMAHSATRIAITGFMPGIAYLNMQREEEE